jgi:hypothetical protein
VSTAGACESPSQGQDGPRAAPRVGID